MMDGRKVYTVSALNRKIKMVLEDEVGAVWVEGEISAVTRSGNGHAYFTLKDEGASIRAVLFNIMRSPYQGQVVEGRKVRIYGEITTYAPSSSYQVLVRRVEALGEGDLLARFLELKERLQREGLFDVARKRPLPELAQRVGIVTSPSGSVIHDMLKVFERRYPNIEVRLVPVAVQGVGAAEQIVAAIELFNRVCGVGSAWPADLLIVGRGGGSLEDLWAFNEEIVARAVGASTIPVISAVGHDTDTVLCDFAADVRAATPSVAAELAVPVKSELVERVALNRRRLAQALRQRVSLLTTRLARVSAARFLRHPQQITESYAQRVDLLAMRLQGTARERLQVERRRVEQATGHLTVLRQREVQSLRSGLALTSRRLAQASKLLLERRAAQVKALHKELELLDPLAVLRRGYTLTRTVDGSLVRTCAQVEAGTRLVTQVADGEIGSVVESTQ